MTTTKERPILFSAPMVRAILAGRKTMTRRIVKPQPNWSGKIACEWYEPTVIRRGIEEPGPQVFGFANEDEGWKCPYGSPGDRLWVRETYGYGWHDRVGGYSALRPTGEQYDRPDKVFYKADFPADDEKNGKRCWRPSIHMPRWASRITLQVESLRVERLQDITEEDAIAEGMHKFHGVAFYGYDPNGTPGTCVGDSAGEAFRLLWNNINGHDAWDANPWVWVVSFRVVKP